MVKEHKSKDKIKGVFNSPLEKANTMEKDDDVISNKSKTKYTNIKNEVNYETSSISSSYKGSFIEKRTNSQLSGLNKGDENNGPWTSLGPKSEMYVDLVNSADISQTESQGTPAVELVVAVKSAIKQRQDLLEEWKQKAETTMNDLHKTKQEKNSLEELISDKNSLITKITQELSEIQKKFNSVNDDSKNYKKEFEIAKLNKEKLNSLYHCALQELSDARKKLAESDAIREKLERRCRIQEEENEHWFQKGGHIEAELTDAKNTIKNLKSEIEDLEEKLANFQTQFASQPILEKKTDEAIEALKEKLKQSLNDLKREIDKNRNNTGEIMKLQKVIDKIELEKKELQNLLEENNNQKKIYQSSNLQVQNELNQWKSKADNVQSSCHDLRVTIEKLEEKLSKYEVENALLKENLQKAKNEKEALQEELENTEKQLTENQSQLSYLTYELEQQKNKFFQVQTDLKFLQNEKSSVSQKLKNQEDVDKRLQNELSRLIAENKTLKQCIENTKNDLDGKSDVLCKLESEAKGYQKQLLDVEKELAEQKAKHSESLFVMQEKAKSSNDYWKNYIEKEISQLKSTYMEKLHRQYEEYSSMVAQSNSRDISFASEAQIAPEIVDEISHLKRQLNDSTKKLEDTIHQAENSRKSLLDKTSKQQQQLLDKLFPQNKSEALNISQLETKIQSIISKFMDENNALYQLGLENKSLKDKIEKYKKRFDENKNVEIASKELIAERDQLRIDLGHSKNLTLLAEEACDRLKQDLFDLKRKFDEKIEMIEQLKNEQISLKKSLGKKSAQISILSQTIEKLKNKISNYTKESSRVKCTIDSLEHDKIIAEKDLYMSKSEIMELKTSLEHAKSSKREVSLLNERLNKEMFDLRCDIQSKTNDLDIFQQKINQLQKQLNESHQEIRSLKDKLKDQSLPNSRDEKNFNELMEKFIDSNKKISKLQQQLSQITSEAKNNEKLQQSQLHQLGDEIKSKMNESQRFSDIIKKEEEKNKKLSECLNITDEAFYELTKIYDKFSELIFGYFKIESEELADPFTINHIDCVDNCCYGEKLKKIKLIGGKLEKLREAIENVKQNEKVLNKELNNLRDQYELIQSQSGRKLSSQNEQIERLQKIINTKQDDFEKIHQQLIDVHLMQSSQSDDLSKSITEHMEKQRYALSMSEENKVGIKNELENVKKRMQNLLNEKRDIETKMQDFESKCSLYQIKIVTLEGEIENLTLKLKEYAEKDIEQSELINKLTEKNGELNDQIIKSRLEIQKLQIMVSENDKVVNISSEEEKDACSNKHCCTRSKCSHLHSSLKDLELEKALLQEKLETTQKSEHTSRLNMVSLEDKIKTLSSKIAMVESEKACLEGWVQHLQQILKDGNEAIYPRTSSESNPYSEIDIQKENNIQKLKEDIKNLELEKSQFIKEIDKLGKQIENIKSNQPATDHFRILAERDDLSQKLVLMRKMSDEKDVEVSNLKSEIIALKQRRDKSVDTPRTENDTIASSDFSLDKRVTACVVTYSHKSDSKNNSISRDSQSLKITKQEHSDYKCDDCDFPQYDKKHNIHSKSQQMQSLNSSSIKNAASGLKRHLFKQHLTSDISEEQNSKKKQNKKKKTIL